MGGLLMGAVANMRPGLFRGIIAYVPWLVDVVGNPAAQEEVGDPDKEEHYWYMLSYSPYDNVKAQDYPNMLVTAAFAELPEQYFEPVRWVAKLRSLKTDDNRLLLRTNMHASHTGPTALYEQSRERAFQYAFMLDLLGIGQ